MASGVKLGRAYVEVDIEGQRRTQQRLAGMIAIFNKLADAAVAAGRQISRWAIDFGKEAVRVTQDYNEAVNRLTSTFKDNGAAVKAWSDTTAKALGRSKILMADNVTMLFRFLRGMQFADDQALALSKRLTKFGFDYASYFDVSDAEAFRELRSILAGETEVARRRGVNISADALKAQAAARGWTGSLSELQKTTLRLEQVFKQLADVEGDIARTSGSLQNSMKQLQAQFEELYLEVGPALIEILKEVIGVLKQVDWQAVGTALRKGVQAAPATARAASGDWIGLLKSVLTPQEQKQFWQMFGKAGMPGYRPGLPGAVRQNQQAATEVLATAIQAAASGGAGLAAGGGGLFGGVRATGAAGLGLGGGGATMVNPAALRRRSLLNKIAKLEENLSGLPDMISGFQRGTLSGFQRARQNEQRRHERRLEYLLQEARDKLDAIEVKTGIIGVIGGPARG